MFDISSLDAFVQTFFFAAIVGGAWIGGRSKYRDRLIADLTTHNGTLQDRVRLLENRNEVLENGFKEDIIRGVVEGLS